VRDGWKITEVAERLGVSRQSVYRWIVRYERGRLPALADRSHRPETCSHQIAPDVEALICELRRRTPAGAPAGSCTSSAVRDSIPCRDARASTAASSATTSSSCGGDANGGTSSGASSESGPCSCGRWTSWPASCSTTAATSRSSPGSTTTAASVSLRLGARLQHDNQMFSVGNAYKGQLVDAFVDDTTIQVWSHNHLIKTVARLRKGRVRKVRADGLHLKHQPEPQGKPSAGA